MKKLLGYGLPLLAVAGLIVGITLQCIGQEPGGGPGGDPPDVDNARVPSVTLINPSGCRTDGKRPWLLPDTPPTWVQVYGTISCQDLQEGVHSYYWTTLRWRWLDADGNPVWMGDGWWQPQTGQGPNGLFAQVPQVPFPFASRGFWDVVFLKNFDDGDIALMWEQAYYVEIEVYLFGTDTDTPTIEEMYANPYASYAKVYAIEEDADRMILVSDAMDPGNYNFITGNTVPEGDEE